MPLMFSVSRYSGIPMFCFQQMMLWLLVLATGLVTPVPAQCPPDNLPGPVDGLGSGPGSTDRTFGYDSGDVPSFLPLVTRIGAKFNIPVTGDIRTAAVQRLGGNADKFILGGSFRYTVPGGGPTYRNLIRLNANGTVDTSFTPPDTSPVNALAVDSSDRIVVGAESAPRLQRLLPGGTVDGAFTPPASITAAVLAVEVDPSDNVYVGLNGGTIGVAPTIKQNFARLTPAGAIDTTGFWGSPVAPNFPVSVGGSVRAIRYGGAVYFGGLPGLVVVGQFNSSTGGNPGTSPLPNIAVFDTTGQIDTFLQFAIPSGTNGPVNAVAILPNAPVDDVFIGGAFSSFASSPSPRVAKFNVVSGPVGGFSIPPAVAASLPNPVRSLLLTDPGPSFTAVFPPAPTLSVLHVGGTQSANSNSGNVAVAAVSGASVSTPVTQSPFFGAGKPAVVSAMAANQVTGAVFGGEFLNSSSQKMVATFNPNYAPPAAPSAGLPGFEGTSFGPAQFYASLLLSNGDLLVAGDVGVDSTGILPVTSPDDIVAELYRLTPCGNLQVLARFRNISGYVVPNDIDNGAFVSPPSDINTTPGMGFRRIDVVDPPSVRALALGPGGTIYVGGQFNQVGQGPSGPFVAWNNLVRLLPSGAIDPAFQVGSVNPNPIPGYPDLRVGGPAGFGITGSGFSTVDPGSVLPALTGTCGAPPPPPPPGAGEKFNPNDGRVNAIAVYSDGRVLIGGEFKSYNQVPRSGLARLLPNGALDFSFGNPSSGIGDYQLCANPVAPGTVPRTDPAVSYQRGRINAMVLDESTGQITVAGLFATANGVTRYNVARFAGDGTLDTSFATGPTGTFHPTGTTGLGSSPVTGPNQGVTTNGRAGEIFAMVRQSVGPNAGRLVLGGEFGSIVNPAGTAAAPAFRPALARLLVTPSQLGHLDTSFGGHSVFVAPSINPQVRALAVDSQDRLFIGGPFRLGPRDTLPLNGLGYTTNTTRGRIHRLSPNGGFADGFTPLNVPAPVWTSVPSGVPVFPFFQPGPYAGQLSGVPSSIFGSGGSEISYFPLLPVFAVPPFGFRYTDPDLTVNTFAFDVSRRRVYAAGLFNTYESLRGDTYVDNGAPPSGLSRNILWPGVVAMQTNCAYGAVQSQVTPLVPVQPGNSLTLPAVNPSGSQFPVLTVTRAAASQCLAQPSISTSSAFVTIVGAIPNPVNPAFLDIVVNVSANTSGTQRTGNVSVVLPSEGPAPPPVTISFDQAPVSGCVFSASANPSNFPVAGGSGTFAVTTGTGCAWTISGLPSWITASPLGGNGSGTVGFTVAANSGTPRSATVSVAGQNVTITQDGTCTLSLSAPSPGTLPAAGGSGTFTVTTPGGCSYTASTTASWLTLTGASGSGTGTVTFTAPNYNSGTARTATIGVTVPGAGTQTVTVTQASDGKASTVGMFRPVDGFFYLRFSNTSGFADTSFFYGLPNDIPLSGDWNGDGVTTIGIFRGTQFFLRDSNSAGFATVPAFTITGTQPGDIPVVGDWDGNGTVTAGLYRPVAGGGVFLLRNTNASGPADITFTVTTPTGSLPLAGDWDGDARTTVGLYLPATGIFSLYTDNTTNAPVQTVLFGQPGDIPVVGDWNADGITTIGVVRPLPSPSFFLRNTNTSGPADLQVNYGQAGDRPVVGKWQ